MKPLVMFVDDDPMVLASISRQLARKLTTIDFIFCDGGVKALAEAEKRPPDVMFSDMRMPAMSGLVFLTEFLKKHTTTTCFVLTGQLSDAELVEAETLVEKVLAKPVDLAVVRELIEAVISRRIHHQPVNRLRESVTEVVSTPVVR